MLSSRFLSEIGKYKLVPLGRTQKTSLYLFSTTPYSVYDIHSRLKKEIDIKNVRKTVNRLYSLGLIEIEGYYPRNAKKYRLTSCGLFQLLANSQVPVSILSSYKDDIIIQTVLFQYFDIETIRAWLGLEAPFLLIQYVEKSCRAILSSLQEFKSMTKKYQKNKEFVKNKSLHLRSFLENAINRTISELDLNIVLSRFEYRYPDTRMVPMIALARDMRFIGRAQKMKRNFLDGCKDFCL